ncbi:glycoside hydrolase [Streptomyces phage FrodoSwaggins]|uniref:Glycoside hydrolase n=3 Tax=Rimavirus drgrey TaxID=2560783 RepID=A0A649VWI6_9CAUD|nr:chitosanase [Streptomyces phage DrGrey]ASU03934.1 chitosanase [Streptomyces phage DrGrey]QAY17055.1 chitosanase [Streptomyces phage Popy]QGJ96561.1 glycoside hydrolase [Streptomyces phage FrodoSwaggins]
MSYSQNLVDEFADGTIDTTKWTITQGPGTTEADGFLKQTAVPDYPRIEGKQLFDISNGILAAKLSHSGAPTSATEIYVGAHDASGNAISALGAVNGSYITFQPTGLAIFSDEVVTDETVGVGPSWVEGSWWGIGNMGPDNVIHMYNSVDGQTWNEMARCTVGGTFNKSAVGLVLMTGVWEGTSTWTTQWDDASFWELVPDNVQLVKVRSGGLWVPSKPKVRSGGMWVDVNGKVKVRQGGTWVLLPGSNSPVPMVSAGPSETIAPSSTFTRTATEDDSGSPITNRSWEIVSGPLGSGTVIGTDAALSWVPGSSPLATVDIRQPVCQEMAFELTSTAENSTTDWTTSYNYIEDIGDDRGYTAGLVGFTSATGDMLVLIQNYAEEYPGNALEGYIPGLEQCAAIGYGPDASAAAANYLGAAFMTAWINEADAQPGFRKVQRDMRKSTYWDDCLVQALADGVGPLGLALHYDILVNHGIGEDSQSYGGIIAAARASDTPPPSAGGDEAAYLTKLCDLRDAVLQDWGDYNPLGRSSMFRSLIDGGKLDLLGLITWSIYGDSFSFNRPNPPADAQLGDYVLRYSATNAFGTSSSETTITVDVV